MEISNPLSNINLTGLLKGKNLIYLVVGVIGLVLLILVIAIIAIVNNNNANNGNTEETTPTPTIIYTVKPSEITTVPVIESQNFLYIKLNNNNANHGELMSFDVKSNKANEISNNNIFKSLISFSPNNKYLLVQLLDSNKDKYAVFNLENKTYNLINTDNIIYSYWADNNYLNILTENRPDSEYRITSLNVFDNKSSIILTIPTDLVLNPLISKDLKYLVGINKNDDDYHFIDLSNKVDRSIRSLNLSSGSSFNPIEWTKDNKLIFNSDNGLYLFNPILLNSSQLASLGTKNEKLEIKFLNYNEDFKSILFMLDGLVHRYNINTDITKEVFNNNDRSDIKTISLKGNGLNYFLMENYNKKLEIYNISNSRLVTICDSQCMSPIWYF